MKNILLISQLNKGSGNLHTIERIRTYLEDSDHSCKLLHPEHFNDEQDLRNFVSENQIELIIGLHAFRAGQLLQDINIPHVIIIGGTDVNELCRDDAKLSVMKKAVLSARRIVCFSSSLLLKTRELWPEVSSDQCVVIKQGVDTSPSEFSLTAYVQENHPDLYRKDMIVCICVGGIRPVKNPLYLVEAFSDLHKKDRRVIYVLCGDVADESYGQLFKKTISRLPGIIYIPGLPLSDTHAAIQQSFAFINSSESEGMALAILEAMQLKTPVIVRNIEGNKELVKDWNDGFIFSSPEECICSVKRLIKDKGIGERLVASAYQYVKQEHSIQKEKALYRKLAMSCTEL